jgi:hypothetical protein
MKTLLLNGYEEFTYDQVIEDIICNYDIEGMFCPEETNLTYLLSDNYGFAGSTPDLKLKIQEFLVAILRGTKIGKIQERMN